MQKAPAATIETLARAVKRDLQAPNPVEVIGTRHGEKLYETLLTREEWARAEDWATTSVCPPTTATSTTTPTSRRDRRRCRGRRTTTRTTPAAWIWRRRLNCCCGLDLVQEELGRQERKRSGVRMAVGMKIMTILGTRPEIIRLSAVIPLLDAHSTHILVHTGQNYDDRLNGLFFAS